MATIREFISSNHAMYNRYKRDWLQTYNAYIGGVEWRKGRYLKHYEIDSQTPSEAINVYGDGEEGGSGVYKAQLYQSRTSQINEAGLADQEGTFYYEKLHSTPLFPYVRLYVSEYNSILFKNPHHRKLYEDDSLSEGIIKEFCKDVDGEGNSINEFWSQIDTLSTIYGVVWISCVKNKNEAYPYLAVHSPLQVNNWEYNYTAYGKTELSKVSILIDDQPDVSVYRVFTPTTISTIWQPKDDAFTPPAIEGIVYDDGVYVYTEVNELGYIPVKPIYQSMKVYDGVGHTPMFDIAQIQRSVYNYNAEIYSGITYGAHPVTLVDQETSRLNNNNVGAEPGTTITVPAGITGQNYTFEFKAPPLDSIQEIRALIDQMIEKMNTTAMIRSEDLIKASRSGAQIEQYDTKLEAFIRKKATSLENAEYQLWMIWHDWMRMTPCEDFTISYNKMYGNKSMEGEIKIVSGLMDLLDKYEAKYAPTTDITPAYNEGTEQSMETVYPHTMVNPETGEEVQVQNEAEHTEYANMGWEHPEQGETYPETPEMEDQEEIEEMREALKKKFKQLLMSSYTENSQ